MRRLWMLLAVCLLWAGLAVNAQTSQDPGRIGLFADNIAYDAANDTLIATGNVKVLFRGQVLTTERVIYRQSTNELFLPEPLAIVDPDGTTVFADAATLNIELQQGLINGARLLLNDQFQLAAQEFSRPEPNFKVLTKVVGSTCYVCEKSETPFWQIRSKRIIHDELEKRLYFEDSTLQLFGVPVFYAPYLSTPDPSVRRATGFLVPEISQSNRLGYGLEIPYYIVLDDHSDATLTPFVSTKEAFVLSGEYRRNFRNGSVLFQGAVALADPLSTSRYRSYVQGSGQFNLARDYKLSFGVHLAADDTFKTDYSFGDEDRLNNFVTVERTRADRYVSYGASFTQSLRAAEIDQNIPLVVPDIYYRQTGGENLFGGNYGLTLQSVGLIREQSGFLRAGAQLDWTKFWRTQNGLIFGVYSELSAQSYLTDSYTNGRTGQSFGSTSLSKIEPLVAAEIRYPLSKTTARALHVIEPIAQLVWSRENGATVPNEDSAQAEFEETNLFATNRFPGVDATERGLRANVGLSYQRYGNDGWELDLTFGRVFREKDLGQFPQAVSAGLSGVASDYVGAIGLRLPNRFELRSRALFDSDFKVSKNETAIGYSGPKITADLSYVWLDQNVVLNSNTSQHELRLATKYQASDFWAYSFDWRQNLNNGEPIEGIFGVEYENECATVNFSVSLDYDALGNVTREYNLKLSLEGLGNRKDKRRFTRRCGV